MALALTIFAVEGPGLAPTFCHVLLRMARGHGAYPPPLLPKTPALPPPVARSAINGTNLTLLVWDRSVSDVDAADLLVALDRGDFSVPADAPHLHNLHIPGAVYGPVIVDEPMQRANVSGSGMLLLRGLATEAPLKALVDALTVAVPPGSAPTTVKAISAAIVGASSIGDVLKPQLVLGGVDYYHRPIPPSASEGALFNVAAPPPDVRNPRPMNRVIVRRHAALLGTPYRLVLRLGDSDSTLADTILDIEAGVAEVTVSAPGHINDIDMRVFTPAGVLVDQLNGRFGQEMQFDLTVLSGADTLPPPFAGAPDAKDLQTRTRVTTTHFERPAPKGLSAGLGVLRKARGQLERLVGKDPQDLEDIWFDRGPNSQIEGIRWLKTKMESPRVSHAYLVDPFLGSEALTRVIARQGNESIDLKVLVSPGNVDPDSGSVDTPSGGDFLDRLAATAAEWSDRLAGRIELVHMQRGTGARQAFHDRYFCIVGRGGVPRAYLLSNSLSKAAGDWPFAICELDRVTSWRVFEEIERLLRKEVAGIEPHLLWRRGPSQSPATVTQIAPPKPGDPNWVGPAGNLLNRVWNVIIQNTHFENTLAALFSSFLANLPEGLDHKRFAKALLEIVGHRDHIVIFTEEYFRRHGYEGIADDLGERFVDLTLSRVPTPGARSDWHINFEHRASVLHALGQVITRKPDPTTFVRDELNPKVNALIVAVEHQRMDWGVAWQAQEAALFLCITALEVAASADADERFRVGMAIDYVHWVGRLARSNQSPAYADHPEFRADIELAGVQILKANRALGGKLGDAIEQVLTDQLVCGALRDILLPK